ncbi:hypothetical protein E3T55_18985 [Cryobacterium frigoriphilum]|uniref:Sortase n=1 Tax=Cryobacterium frigoriphilum TaxID=1259150 RepID=A0A4R8ZTN1_9MICO|nr:hypothetical protein [Cryobacterium frigoriphilum]TFD45355.1 hypothetical protein E3T55_18985 [Cryobacterium frigoriphilum]
MNKSVWALTLALFASLGPLSIPAASATYVPDAPISTTVTGQVVPSGTVTVAFGAGSFLAAEPVSLAFTGAGRATLAAARAGTITLTKTTDAAGSLLVDVTLPATASGSYTLVATGLTSATVGAATIIVGGYASVPGAQAGAQADAQAGAQAGADTAARQVVTAEHIAVSGDDAAGGTSSVSIAAAAFTPHEDVAFAVVGSGSATLSALRAASVSLVISADARGAADVTVTLPDDAAGVYAVSAQGLSSKTVANTTITVGASAAAAAQAGVTAGAQTGVQASTSGWLRGYTSPLLYVWIAAGLSLLALGLIGVLRLKRP